MAVAAFLRGDLSFTGIADLIEDSLQQIAASAADSIDAVIAADAAGRAHAAARLPRIAELNTTIRV